MKCLILAAGKGSRLQNVGDSKPLMPLLGLTLIEQVILTAHKAGLTDFFVITGYNSEKVTKHLEQFARARNINITTINNDDWKKENGVSVLKAKEHIKENFVLLMSDHIFDETILIGLMNQKINNDEVILAVDYNIKDNKLVDIDDATKIDVQNNNIKDIGKKINKYNAFDTGIFLCSPEIFNAIEESSQKEDNSLSGGIRILANKKKVKIFDIKGSYWIDVDDENMLKKAEIMLENLKKNQYFPQAQV